MVVCIYFMFLNFCSLLLCTQFLAVIYCFWKHILESAQVRVAKHWSTGLNCSSFFTKKKLLSLKMPFSPNFLTICLPNLFSTSHGTSSSSKSYPSPSPTCSSWPSPSSWRWWWTSTPALRWRRWRIPSIGASLGEEMGEPQKPNSWWTMLYCCYHHHHCHPFLLLRRQPLLGERWGKGWGGIGCEKCRYSFFIFGFI